jgi:nitroimidazol reductase NimA-like FMN-containing flavoprotein (pyridoxamine 5'-phosphate oxidase superfamily)
MHAHSGDLGRRIAEQRGRVGLSRAETADQAGMAESYLRYLETSPAPHPGEGDLIRLAAVLGTTAGALGGAGLQLPPGQRRAGRHPVLEALGAKECREYLGPGGVGRFLYDTGQGPEAVPVNYRMLGDDVIFRTADDSGPAAAARQPRVSFQADHLDSVLAEGWSVLVHGTATVITGQADLEKAAALGIEPWAGGDRDIYVRLVPDAITGRRIRAVTESWPQ